MRRLLAPGLACLAVSAGVTAAAIATPGGAPRPAKPRIVGPRRTTDRTPTFTFISQEAGVPARVVRFRCAVDRTRLRRCPSRYTPRLGLGLHTLRVRAFDTRGRLSPTTKARVSVVRPLQQADQTIGVGRDPYNVAEGFGSVWVTVDAGLVRLDPTTGAVVAHIDLGGRPWGVATGGGAVWIGNESDGTIARVDPGTNAIVWRARLDADPLPTTSPVGVAYGGGSVWSADNGGDRVWRVDPATGAILSVAHVADSHEFVGFGEGGVWVASESGRVGRLDPASGSVTKVTQVGADADFLGFSPGSVWVTNYRTDKLWRLDPTTGDVAGKITIGTGAQGVVFDGSSLWVAMYDRGEALRVDPSTGKVLRRVRVGVKPRGIAFADDSVWVANSRSGTVSRIQTAGP